MQEKYHRVYYRLAVSAISTDREIFKCCGVDDDTRHTKSKGYLVRRILAAHAIRDGVLADSLSTRNLGISIGRLPETCQH
jgi:hypothetical protein